MVLLTLYVHFLFAYRLEISWNSIFYFLILVSILESTPEFTGVSKDLVGLSLSQKSSDCWSWVRLSFLPLSTLSIFPSTQNVSTHYCFHSCSRCCCCYYCCCYCCCCCWRAGLGWPTGLHWRREGGSWGVQISSSSCESKSWNQETCNVLPRSWNTLISNRTGSAAALLSGAN